MRLAQFSSGAHAEVYKALRQPEEAQGEGVHPRPARQRRRPGLRGAAGRQRVPHGRRRSSPPAGARSRARRSRRPATPSARRARWCVLVDRGTASASEIVAGALQDRKRAEVVGTRTFGKGVFQEVIELSNGGALDITAGQYFTPSGRNLGGEGVKTGARHHPRRQGHGRRQDGGRRGALDRARGVVGKHVPPRGSDAGARRGSSELEPARALPRRRAVLRARAAGHRRRSSRRPARRPRRCCGRDRRAGAHAVDRGPRAPRRRARRARGADARPRPARRFPPGVERAAAEARDTSREPDADAPRPARPGDVHDRPGHRQGLRRRDQRRGARRRAAGASGSTSPTSAPTCARVGRRPRGLPPRHARLRARAGRADAARGAVQRRLLAAPGRGPPRRHRASWSCDGADVRQGARSTARSSAPTSAWTTTASTASSPAPSAAEDPWAQPLAAARAAAAALQAAPRPSGGALAIESGEPEFSFDRARPRRGLGRRPSRPSRTGSSST